MIDSITVLIIYIFYFFPASSWINLGKLFVSRNPLVALRVPNLLVCSYLCFFSFSIVSVVVSPFFISNFINLYPPNAQSVLTFISFVLFFRWKFFFVNDPNHNSVDRGVLYSNTEEKRNYNPLFYSSSAVNYYKTKQFGKG